MGKLTLPDKKAPKQVRYKVKDACFVNGSLAMPSTTPGKDNFVVADEGLEGPALELAPDETPQAAPPS